MTAEQIAEMWSECAEKMNILHANGGTSSDAVVAAANSSYAPLFTPDPSLVATLGAFYGLDASFPATKLIVRSPTAKSLLLVADEVLELLKADASTGYLRVVNTGVHVLERELAKGVECKFRICQDGLAHILPHVAKQTVRCSRAAAAKLLSCKQSVLADELGADADLSPLTELLKASCKPGSVIVCCEAAAGDGKAAGDAATAGAASVDVTDGGSGGDGGSGDGAAPQVSFVCLYAASGGLGPMVKPLERQALLFRLGMAPMAAGGKEGASGSADAEAEAAAGEGEE